MAFVPPRDHILFAVTLSNIGATTNVTSICLLDSHSDGTHCEAKIRAGQAFLPYLSTLPNWRPSLYAAIDKLRIEWVQFGRVNKTAPIELFHLPVLDLSDPSFHFFAWLFVYDWAMGNREVISFQGDLNTLTAMGNDITRLEQTVDVAQLPTIFAFYALQAIRYVTFVMIMLAAVTFVYILLSRGYVEGLNMFEMSRVGGIVWVGRPLVVVRSITALCLLSTASIELQTDGVFSYFVTTPVPLWTTCLAANEVTWLVGIVNDISLVWTQDHTIAYATINSLLMWLISALLATLAPVQATITVSPTCEIATLDYQVVCVAGSVVIGSLQRLLTLVGIVLVCNGVCFGLVRCLWKRGLPRVSSSMLLCGGAKYLFEHDDWILGDVYHLDRASAVLNGLLSVRYQNQWVIFDVKTWCVRKVQVASDLRVRTFEDIVLVDRRFGRTLPLGE
ncbi:hypothetical protein SDRG_13964 [Saprolegnia diclina VS20]|uniref:Transmembrane protein n=1 Tax=Saprolegnia diclina (strain VS20) TaxID=1156394 RepID=T0R878_SAPDV|nr:hypothetical protein SDRG_13964 [Saprolegnia diclina VS20]EQC28283.1 hypothetical protein SDRG_13964 [Saprolegnia diclina VS20]|eukprot:XP_008618287.1 hypothetical protein SDRG_13964 [Saprolegnia diclina VS20]